MPRNQARATVEGHVLVAPPQEDEGAIERLRQVHQVDEQPHEPGDKAVNLEATNDADTGISPDHSQVAFIEIAEWL